VRERALTFGPDGILVGVLTEPDPEVALPNAPAHVILNSGIIHRVGSSRIYVTLARAAAQKGFTSLRFDFSGVGDSGTRRDSIPIEERFVTETQEAMEYMADITGVDRFIVGGLCSGADGAFWAGLQDDRIDGMWQIDPFTYRTFRYYLRRYGPRLIDPRAWLHSIKVRLPDSNGEAEDEVFVAPEYRRVFPPRQVVHDGLESLLKRDVALYVFLTGDSDLNYPGQFSDAFPGLQMAERTEIRYLPDATHTVTGLEHQAFLEEDLVEWMVQNWGVGTPGLRAGSTS
jgi:pimeloyl-ACP methyl ester carboxylesterase